VSLLRPTFLGLTFNSKIPDRRDKRKPAKVEKSYKRINPRKKEIFFSFSENHKKATARSLI
jgi:hypothetical protein